MSRDDDKIQSGRKNAAQDKVKRGRRRIYEAPEAPRAEPDAPAHAAREKAAPEKAPTVNTPPVNTEVREVAQELPSLRAESSSNPGPEPLRSLRLLRAREIVRTHMMWSMGIGSVPIPIVDGVGTTLVVLAMLRKLAVVYHQEFTESRVRTLLTALAGGGGSVLLTQGVLKVFSGGIPGFRSWLAPVAGCLSGGAVTYAIGQVFVEHFESGGTFLSFDPVRVREHYRKELKYAESFRGRNRVFLANFV